MAPFRRVRFFTPLRYVQNDVFPVRGFCSGIHTRACPYGCVLFDGLRDVWRTPHVPGAATGACPYGVSQSSMATMSTSVCLVSLMTKIWRDILRLQPYQIAL